MRGSRTTRNFISHAHGDHVAGFESKAENFSTIETKEVYTSRGMRTTNFKPLRCGERVVLSDLEITAHDAGHMLGSAQYEIQTPETSVLYTGDINCREALTTSKAEIVPCDILIIEATYGLPFYVFPERDDVYREVVEWALNQVQNGKTPVFQVYSAGKAQEVIRLLNTFTKVPVVTNSAITKVNDVYTRYGVSMDFIDLDAEEGKELIKKHECAYVIPTSQSYPIDEGFSRAFVTGWALKFKPRLNGNTAFPLSAHADFIQLVNYVEEAKPKKVYTVHGYKEEFADFIRRKLGINAEPIPPLQQTRLGEYL